jgi:hypothetical protein
MLPACRPNFTEVSRTSFEVEQTLLKFKVECCHDHSLYWLNYRSSSCISVNRDEETSGTGSKMKHPNCARPDVAAERVTVRSTRYVLRIKHVSCGVFRNYKWQYLNGVPSRPSSSDRLKPSSLFFKVQESCFFQILVSSHTTLFSQQTNYTIFHIIVSRLSVSWLSVVYPGFFSAGGV